MRVQEKIFLVTIFLAVLLMYTGLKDGTTSENRKSFTLINLSQIQTAIQKLISQTNRSNQKTQDCPTLESINFIRTDNNGNDDGLGANYVLILDPKAKDLDFKVSLGLANKLYDKDDNDKFRQKYVPKLFRELISDENSTLDGKRPIAAINGDYIGTDNKPQGLNISRGIEYSGPFKDKHSSFGISGGKPEERKATIQIGKRKGAILNYNLVGGNGRFFTNGKFKDICPDLGDYICGQETSRSLGAITSKGYVVFLVNNGNLQKALYPSKFDDVLNGIAENNCLGKIKDGMLFDVGFSTGFYFNKKIYVEHSHPVGSVFLIYKK